MELEAPLSDNKENEENEEDDNKSNEKKKKHNENYPNTKKFSKLRKNNLVYYFKFPELVLLYYKFLKVSIRIEEQTALKTYLTDIYVDFFNTLTY